MKLYLYFFLVIVFYNSIVNEIYSSEISLDGQWLFAVDSSQTFNISNVIAEARWMSAVVPRSWQGQFENLRDYQGTAWYLKKIHLPQFQKDKAIVLKFEAVDYLAEVYVNNKLIGAHEGGYTPFEFEIQKNIKPGENEIIVKVFDPVQGNKTEKGINYSEIPHGKQSWYVQNSGIWQSCYIQIRPLQYVKNVHITPSMDGEINFNIFLNNGNTNNNSLIISILDNENKEIKKETLNASFVNNKINQKIKISNPRLWSIESPDLYKAKIIFNNDTLVEQFGFRTFEAKNKKFYLNDKPIYIIGALDQDFYPETIYTPSSEDYIKNEMLKAKRLGLNMLRCHIKVPDKRYLKAADEVGILIWYEIPNRDTFTVEGAKRSSRLLDEMFERDWNHPSIVIFSIINESWGIDLQQKEQREWLKNEYKRVKEKNSGWLIVDNSACYGNFHIITDINDYHTYWSIPDWHNKFSETVKEISKRPNWLFSEFGDSEETGNEPLMISEFGNWGLPKLPEELPWWFERRFEDIDITVAAGVDERFKQYKYNELFNNLDELAECSQQSQFTALKYEIEQIRLNPEIQGYIITEFTDLNWECNGLLDMWRNFKIYSNDLSEIQRQDLIIPVLQKYSYINGEIITIDLYLSHYDKKTLSNSQLYWDAGRFGSAKFNIENIKYGEVSKINPVEIRLSGINEAEDLQINFSLRDDQGNILSRNFVKINILPRIKNIHNVIYIYNSDGNSVNLNTNDNFSKLTGDKKEFLPNEIIITNVLDDKVAALLKDGAKVLLLADSTTKFIENFPFKILNRNEGWYDGNWISNMNWVKNNHPLYRNLKMNRIMGFESSSLLPGYILTEIPPEYFSDVMAGMFVGWLHLNSAYLMQMKADKGRLLICTLQVQQVMDDDAYAKYFFNELINYMVSDKFNPKISLRLQ